MEVISLPGLAISELTGANLPAAMRLVEESRWNQVTADWDLFLTLGSALKVTSEDGRLVATAAVLPYRPRFGWIGMVLVSESHRRRGIATALLQLCVQRLRAAGLVPMLDATPAGREVYQTLGFRDGWPLSRWRRPDDATTAVLAQPLRPARPLQDSDWAGIAALDARAFGADRIALLRRLAERSGRFACVMEEDGRVAGFLLGREGRVATQLGPIVAEREELAHALLAYALPRSSGAVLVDAPDRHQGFTRQLAQSGFSVERSYTRMALDHTQAFGEESCVMAIAGPELG
jgi:GNAT superfamily N-acetyltransferase